MNYTKSKIFNLTLKNLRVSVGIQNANQTNNKNTIVLNEFYDSAREQVLKDFDWNFANSYRELSLTGNIPLNPKFLYEFDYPNDCLFAREIISYSDRDIVEFEVAANSTGQKVINTNLTPAVLRYTKSVDNETFFGVEFVMALSWYLAFLAAPAITGNRNIQSDCLSVYTSILAKAKAMNASEGFIRNTDNCSWLDER
ncbi:MAG: hypothetical protein LUH11_02015 [Candidatus Gastranaerophilales bacterium]|nr:hypothetical protein [Candidatus Gastranaerophilales bacterium]